MKRKWIAIVAESEERKTPSLSLIFKKKVQIFQTLHSAWAGIGTHLWCFLFVWDRCSLSWAVFAAGFQMEYLSWRCLWYCLEISLSEHFFFYQKWEVSGSFERLVCLVGPSLVIICAQLVIATQLLAEAACVLWAWLEAAVPLDSYQSNICSPVAMKWNCVYNPCHFPAEMSHPCTFGAYVKRLCCSLPCAR